MEDDETTRAAWDQVRHLRKIRVGVASIVSLLTFGFAFGLMVWGISIRGDELGGWSMTIAFIVAAGLAVSAGYGIERD